MSIGETYKENIKKGNPSFNYPSVAYKKNIFDKVGLFSSTFPWNRSEYWRGFY